MNKRLLLLLLGFVHGAQDYNLNLNLNLPTDNSYQQPAGIAGPSSIPQPVGIAGPSNVTQPVGVAGASNIPQPTGIAGPSNNLQPLPNDISQGNTPQPVGVNQSQNQTPTIPKQVTSFSGYAPGSAVTTAQNLPPEFQPVANPAVTLPTAIGPNALSPKVLTPKKTTVKPRKPNNCECCRQKLDCAMKALQQSEQNCGDASPQVIQVQAVQPTAAAYTVHVPPRYLGEYRPGGYASLWPEDDEDDGIPSRKTQLENPQVTPSIVPVGMKRLQQDAKVLNNQLNTDTKPDCQNRKLSDNERNNDPCESADVGLLH